MAVAAIKAPCRTKRSPIRDPRTSPFAIQAPPKPWHILAGVVGIQIDVETRNAIAPELEDIAKTTARSFASSPDFSRHPAVRGALHHDIVPSRNERQCVV